MDGVENYGLTWLIYLVLSAAFLLLSFWHSRKLSFWLRIPILSFIAAMAFTPATTLQGDSWLSPAAIVMVFEIDQNGIAGFWRAGLGIIITWVVLMVISFALRWFLGRKKNSTIVDPQERTEPELELRNPD